MSQKRFFMVEEVGFPGILKASWGGGGRGMRVVESRDEFSEALRVARREAFAAFGKDDLYFERFMKRARHLEVQVLADAYGQMVHLFERDCSVQRRNQKVIECAPAHDIDEEKTSRIDKVCTENRTKGRVSQCWYGRISLRFGPPIFSFY